MKLIEKHPFLLLILTSLLQYCPTLFYGLTKYDDYTFIAQYQPYNQHLTNLLTSFTRGVFTNIRSPYYRPLFLDSILLNYQLCGEHLFGYHLANVLFHVIAVVLLYCLLIRLKTSSFHSFLLAMLFAVHPALTQAVAWIPGRNDTLLAIFSFSFFIFSVDYNEKGTIKSLLLSGLFLVLALFTKESALTLVPVAIILLIVYLPILTKDKRIIRLLAAWVVVFLVWFAFRVAYKQEAVPLSLKQMLYDLVYRLPVILQYLGKLFLPFNLSVYPTQQDTVLSYGYVAIALLSILFLLAKRGKKSGVQVGFIIFLLLLIPSLLVPNAAFNPQCFEHRLYLPILGILLLLPNTIILDNQLKNSHQLYCFLLVLLFFSGINYVHQKNFASPVAYWVQAVATSPNSPITNMMLATQTEDKVRARQLFKKAYQINPKQKYLNLRFGAFLFNQDSIMVSEKYFWDELKIDTAYQCYYYLMHIALENHNLPLAITYMQFFLKNDPFFDPTTDHKGLLTTEILKSLKTEKKIFFWQLKNIFLIKDTALNFYLQY